MSTPVRILDLRLVLDRDGRSRLSVDGRELVRASSASEALRFVADRLAARAPAEQLSALASAIGVAMLGPDLGPASESGAGSSTGAGSLNQEWLRAQPRSTAIGASPEDLEASLADASERADRDHKPENIAMNANALIEAP